MMPMGQLARSVGVDTDTQTSDSSERRACCHRQIGRKTGYRVIPRSMGSDWLFIRAAGSSLVTG